MGLDGIELVMAIEDRFGIQIPDRDASRVRTVGDLVALVVRLRPSPEAACPTASHFYRVRPALGEHGAIHARVRPGTPIREAIAARPCRARDILAMEGVRESFLQRSILSWGVYLFAMAGLALAIAACFAIAAAGGSLLNAAFVAACVAMPLSFVVFVIIEERTRTQWLPRISTFGDLVRETMPKPAKPDDSEHAVLEEVRRITAEQLALPLERIQSHSEFVRDLRVG